MRSSAFAITWDAALRAEVLVDDVEELLQVERLRQVVVDAGVAEPTSLPRRRVGREDHDRDVDGPRIALEPLEHLEAVDVGEVDVEQDEVRAVLLGQFHAHAAQERRDEIDVRSLHQESLDELDVRDVVFDVEHRRLGGVGGAEFERRRGARRGRLRAQDVR